MNHKTYNQNISDTATPRLPIIHKLGSLQMKSCSIFYQTFQAEDLVSGNAAESESRWHEEMGVRYGVQFWDDVWKIVKNALVPNNIKWLQLQINHFILPTNYTVSKYDSRQPPRVCIALDEKWIHVSHMSCARGSSQRG